MNNNKYQKGVIHVLVIIVLLIGILVFSLVSFYILKTKAITNTSGNNQIQESTTPAKPMVEVSSSTDTKTLESELDDTELESIDSDLESLDLSAESL